ncbi:hypothetical protein KEM56_001704 [Ascosphaera pollenicola]|nr:hypothetical protein KEM56_001704 [Ascosphaera pollenicola]
MSAFTHRPSLSGLHVLNGFNGLNGKTPSVMDSRVNGHANGSLRRRLGSFQPSVTPISTSTSLTAVVHALERQAGEELGPTTTAKVMNVTFEGLLEWIRNQRMTKLPPEGGAYDKVLTWAQMFVERVHAFDLAIEGFAPDSYMAAQLTYGYCSILLELGDDRVSALVASVGFFYSISQHLNLLVERAELFAISQEIRDQLIFALGDLVTLVSGVATHFHKALRGLSSAPVSINIETAFDTQIEVFNGRCDKITDAMWKNALIKDDLDPNRVSEIQAIHHWTEPEDRILSHLVDSPSFLAEDREELTCLWLSPYLTRFLKSSMKNLYVTGKPGSGKTVLSSVIIDYLQHPIGGVSYDTIFVPINTQIPAEATPRAALKSILRQLFSKCIGNTALFQALSTALEKAKHISEQNEYDSNLWSAVIASFGALQNVGRSLVLIVDGVDEIEGGAASFLEKLIPATGKADNLKLIVLGSENSKPDPGHAHLTLTSDLIFDDISAVIRNVLKSSKGYADMDELEQEMLVDRISSVSDGSFLWGRLAAKYVGSETTADGLDRAVEALVDSKMTVADFVLAFTTRSTETTDEAKLALLWLSTAIRPLTLQELGALFSVNLEKAAVVKREFDLVNALQPLDPLISIQDGMAYLRHDQIRTAVHDLIAAGKFMAHIGDVNADLVKRMFIYVGSVNFQEHEPSISSIDANEKASYLLRYPLLDFSLQYWVSHVRRMSVFSSQSEKGAAKELKTVFPKSTTLVQLQRQVWENLPTPVLVSSLNTFATIAREVFTPDNVSALQATILLALLFKDIGKRSEAADLFYSAIQTSKKLLTSRHFITVHMSTLFLETTADQVTDSRTPVMTKREEALLLLIAAYKVQYGPTSEHALSTMTQLAKFYQSINEDDKAKPIYLSLQSLAVQVYGANSSEAREISAQNSVNVKRGGREEPTHDTLMLDLDDEQDPPLPAPVDNFDELLADAGKRATEGDPETAEKEYVSLWNDSATKAHVSRSDLWEKRKLDVILAYAKFLKDQKREAEASSLLNSVWQEYEPGFQSSSDCSVSHFNDFASLMKSAGLSITALAVLKKISAHYESTSRHQTQPEEYAKLQGSIEETADEILEQSPKSIQSEATLEEIVSQRVKSHGKTDANFFGAVNALFSHYVKQHRWQDATRLVRGVLEGVWPELFEPSIQDVSLPAINIDSSVELAAQLSRCYHARRHPSQEEDVRTRVYRAAHSGRPLGDKLRENATNELLAFFAENEETDKIIALRQEMLRDYEKQYGPADQQVIELLKTLGEITRPRPIFIDYYKTIVSVINKDSETCLPEAFDAAVIVATELWDQAKYADALPYLKVLFNTLVKEPKSHARFSDPEFVRSLFSHYTHCLPIVFTEHSVLHQTAVDYHAVCKTLFGSSASITIQAALHLAKVCQESKRDELEAIELYEELLKSESPEIDQDSIMEILESLYEDQEKALLSAPYETLSKPETERIMNILKRRVTTTRETLGWDHERPLSRMPTIVKYHKSRNELDAVVEDLKRTTSNVFQKKATTAGLIASANLIAAGYIAANMQKSAHELADELHRQLILRDSRNAKAVGFNVTNSGRENLVFLAQLENSLRQNKSNTLNESLSALIAEYTYFEEFRGLIKAKAPLQQVFSSAARLHAYLITQNRPVVADRVVDELIAYFLSTEGEKISFADATLLRAFVLTVMLHFGAHISNDYIRSVAIAGNSQVSLLLASKRYEQALGLALTSFNYLAAHKAYMSPTTVKFAFNLGMAVAGRDLIPRPGEDIRKKLLDGAQVIVQHSLQVIRDLQVSLTQISLRHLNRLVGFLGEVKDYTTLVWLLGLLWSSREAQHEWPPYVTFALGCRFIIVRYLVGEAVAALRLSEDVVYNCRRVYGPRHPSTLEASVLLTQLYTSIAQRYQAKRGKDMASRYYKKSATIHENILRIFIDPLFAELHLSGPDSASMADSSMSIEMIMPDTNVTETDHARQHLLLLKLAIQRIGAWPKNFSEYEHLVSEVVNQFQVKDIEPAANWNLKDFGDGKAESTEDLLKQDFSDWDLFNEETFSLVPMETSSPAVSHVPEKQIIDVFSPPLTPQPRKDDIIKEEQPVINGVQEEKKTIANALTNGSDEKPKIKEEAPAKEQSIKQSEEKTPEKPVEAPAKAASPDVTEKKASDKAPSEKPKETRKAEKVEEPKQPIEKPVEKPVEKPAEKPVENPVEKPEVKKDAEVKKPVDEKTSAPIAEPATKPKEEKVETIESAQKQAAEDKELGGKNSEVSKPVVKIKSTASAPVVAETQTKAKKKSKTDKPAEQASAPASAAPLVEQKIEQPKQPKVESSKEAPAEQKAPISAPKPATPAKSEEAKTEQKEEAEAKVVPSIQETKQVEPEEKKPADTKQAAPIAVSAVPVTEQKTEKPKAEEKKADPVEQKPVIPAAAAPEQKAEQPKPEVKKDAVAEKPSAQQSSEVSGVEGKVTSAVKQSSPSTATVEKEAEEVKPAVKPVEQPAEKPVEKEQKQALPTGTIDDKKPFNSKAVDEKDAAVKPQAAPVAVGKKTEDAKFTAESEEKKDEIPKPVPQSEAKPVAEIKPAPAPKIEETKPAEKNDAQIKSTPAESQKVDEQKSAGKVEAKKEAEVKPAVSAENKVDESQINGEKFGEKPETEAQPAVEDKPATSSAAPAKAAEPAATTPEKVADNSKPADKPAEQRSEPKQSEKSTGPSEPAPASAPVAESVPEKAEEKKIADLKDTAKKPEEKTTVSEKPIEKPQEPAVPAPAPEPEKKAEEKKATLTSAPVEAKKDDKPAAAEIELKVETKPESAPAAPKEEKKPEAKVALEDPKPIEATIEVKEDKKESKHAEEPKAAAPAPTEAKPEAKDDKKDSKPAEEPKAAPTPVEVEPKAESKPEAKPEAKEEDVNPAVPAPTPAAVEKREVKEQKPEVKAETQTEKKQEVKAAPAPAEVPKKDSKQAEEAKPSAPAPVEAPKVEPKKEEPKPAEEPKDEKKAEEPKAAPAPVPAAASKAEPKKAEETKEEKKAEESKAVTEESKQAAAPKEEKVEETKSAPAPASVDVAEKEKVEESKLAAAEARQQDPKKVDEAKPDVPVEVTKEAVKADVSKPVAEVKVSGTPVAEETKPVAASN